MASVTLRSGYELDILNKTMVKVKVKVLDIKNIIRNNNLALNNSTNLFIKLPMIRLMGGNYNTPCMEGVGHVIQSLAGIGIQNVRLRMVVPQHITDLVGKDTITKHASGSIRSAMNWYINSGKSNRNTASLEDVYNALSLAGYGGKDDEINYVNDGISISLMGYTQAFVVIHALP